MDFFEWEIDTQHAYKLSPSSPSYTRRTSDPDLSPDQRRRVVFFGNTLHSHSGSLNPGV